MSKYPLDLQLEASIGLLERSLRFNGVQPVCVGRALSGSMCGSSPSLSSKRRSELNYSL